MKKNEEKLKAPKAIASKAINEKQMKDLLMELYHTNYWQAIKRFNDVHSIIAENALCTIDPFKNPTIMARQQGIRMGLASLTSYVETEEKRRNEKTEEPDMPSY